MGNHTWKFTVAGALALLAANALAGEITVYEHPGFRGQSITTTGALPNLEQSTLNDFASSVVVGDGTWEVCTEPYFRGRCAQLTPGTYHRLTGDLNGPVDSVRQVGPDTGSARVVISPDSSPVVLNSAPAPVVIQPGAAQVVINPAPVDGVVNVVPAPVVVGPPVVTAAPVAAASHVVLYGHTGSIVRAVDLTSNVDDLDARHFNDSADAALVSGAVWRLCDREGGRGRCSDFSPGQYASLGALNGRVRSAYLVALVPENTVRLVPVQPGRAVLYELPNFGGSQAVVEYGPASDLDWAHFRNPAASVRVESGSWLVCTDLGYQGDCRVLEPGDYPVLTGVLGRGIASARQLWRPDYGFVGGTIAHDSRREAHPALSRYVP
jgi:hypothetical protein